jgi:hypothetical protein
MDARVSLAVISDMSGLLSAREVIHMSVALNHTSWFAATVRLEFSSAIQHTMWLPSITLVRLSGL